MTRVVLLLAVLSAVGLVQGGPDASLRARYTKQEVEIPMRDGVKLFTIVYAPVDTSRAVPILMTRSPYGSEPYGPDTYRRSLGPSAAYKKDGYIFVYQDVRGRFRSGGEFVEMRPAPVSPGSTAIDESTDTYDTIAWLLEATCATTGGSGCGAVLRRVLRRGRAAAATRRSRRCRRRRRSPTCAWATTRTTTARSCWRELQLLHRLLPAARRPVGEGRSPPFNYGTQDG